MMRRIVLTAVVMMVAGAFSGCVSPQKFDNLTQRVTALEENISNQLSALEEGAKKLRTDLDRVEKITSEQLGKLTGRVTKAEDGLRETRSRIDKVDKLAGKTESQVNAVSASMQKLRTDFKDLADRLTKMTASLAEAQKLFLKNLEHTRDMHEAQYRALNEILERFKQPAPKKGGRGGR